MTTAIQLDHHLLTAVTFPGEMRVCIRFRIRVG